MPQNPRSLNNGDAVLVAINIAGIHRVTKKLASGKVVEYHYAFRGGPQFWNSASGTLRGGADYFAAFQHANSKLTERFRRAPKGDTMADLIERYRDSAKFTNLRERTQADYEVWLKRIKTEFGEDPIAMFEEPESVAEIGRWKKTWSGSPKQYDYATSVISVLLNWAVDEDKTLMRHHYHRVPDLQSESRRSDLAARGVGGTVRRRARGGAADRGRRIGRRPSALGSGADQAGACGGYAGRPKDLSEDAEARPDGQYSGDPGAGRNHRQHAGGPGLSAGQYDGRAPDRAARRADDP